MHRVLDTRLTTHRTVTFIKCVWKMIVSFNGIIQGASFDYLKT